MGVRFKAIMDLEMEDALSNVEAVHHALHSLERHFIELERQCGDHAFRI